MNQFRRYEIDEMIQPKSNLTHDGIVDVELFLDHVATKNSITAGFSL
jgi:hypothetical protein